MKGLSGGGKRPLGTRDPAAKGADARVTILEQDFAEKGSQRQPNRRRNILGKKRMWLIAAIAILSTLAIWGWYMRWQEEWEYKQGFLTVNNETYEAAKTRKKHFDGVKIQDLDASLLPGGKSDPDGGRRLVFVGDVHGCADELKHLLEKVGFDEEYDHLIAVGDVISKGPKNAEVLDELMRIGASSVRGNHEDHLLRLAPSVLDADDLPEVEIEKKGKKKDRKLLKELSKRHLRYLRDMPLMLRIPALPQAAKPTTKDHSPIAEEIIVVHAGLVPAIPLEMQDPYFAMNMRSIKWKNHVPLVEASDKKKKSKPWHKIWEWYNDRIFRHKSLKDFASREGELEVEAQEEDGSAGWSDNMWLSISKKEWPEPQVVVYGHHSKAGLKISRWSKGLDTGCVKGERLTALVLDARGRQELVSVRCKKDYT